MAKSNSNSGVISTITTMVTQNPIAALGVAFIAGNAARGLGYKAPGAALIENLCDSTGIYKAKPGSLASNRIAAQKAAAGQVGFLSIDTMESLPK